jgi:cyclophilin family peptidyl-prolyl cis-trans isomerase
MSVRGAAEEQATAMKYPGFLCLAPILAGWLCVAAAQAPAQSTPPRVEMLTSAGTIVIELDRQHAPTTVANFLRYVDTGFYEGTQFHRVIKDFMIQGGGFTREFEQKPTAEPIRNEADNALKNERGTVAMARTSAPHSATAQFYINLVDNASLDHKDRSFQGWGYAVFGKVVEGMDVVDRIGSAETGPRGPFPGDVPQQPIVIERVSRVGARTPQSESKP